MTTSTIREKLHNYLEVTDNTKLQAMYAIIEEEPEESVLDDKELQQEIDRRYQDYKEDKVTMITAKESKTYIQALLGQK